jgi:hypothetical protein
MSFCRVLWGRNNLVKGFIVSASVIERKTLQILVQGILTEGEVSIQLTSLY